MYIKNSIALGTTTMNAGFDMPGSCIQQTLANHAKYFDKVIVVDGAMSERAEKFYSTIKNIKVIDSPWKDNLLTQLYKIVECLSINDWWMMIDDDEVLSRSLCLMILQIKTIDKKIGEILTPRVACITDGSNRFYPAEGTIKQFKEQNYTDKRLLRRHFVKIKEDLNFFSASRGHHCTPYHVNDTLKICIPYPHFHIKAPEQYVIADCQKARLDPVHERFTEKEGKEYIELLDKNNINSYESYTRSVINGLWSEDLKEWAFNHRNIDTPVSRPYFWYFLMAHTEQNKDKSFTWDKALKMILTKEYREKMKFAKENNTFIKMSVTSYLKGK